MTVVVEVEHGVVGEAVAVEVGQRVVEQAVAIEVQTDRLELAVTVQVEIRLGGPHRRRTVTVAKAVLHTSPVAPLAPMLRRTQS